MLDEYARSCISQDTIQFQVLLLKPIKDRSLTLVMLADIFPHIKIPPAMHSTPSSPSSNAAIQKLSEKLPRPRKYQMVVVQTAILTAIIKLYLPELASGIENTQAF